MCTFGGMLKGGSVYVCAGVWVYTMPEHVVVPIWEVIFPYLLAVVRCVYHVSVPSISLRSIRAGTY